MIFVFGLLCGIILASVAAAILWFEATDKSPVIEGRP